MYKENNEITRRRLFVSDADAQRFVIGQSPEIDHLAIRREASKASVVEEIRGLR